MTAGATTLRIPPAIRRRLDGIEAELRPTPQRVPLVGGRPTLVVVDDRAGGRVRPVHRVRRAPVRRGGASRSGWLAAMAGVAAVVTLVAVMGFGAMGSGPSASGGPSGIGGSSGSAASAPASASASASGSSVSAAPSPPLASGAPSGLPPLLTPFPSLVDIQVIRVAADPATAATRLLRTTCVSKEPGLEAAGEKKLLTRAFANKVTGGWVDDAHTMFIATDVIDAGQAFGATILVEGPDETWAIARDAKGPVALLLQDMPTIEGRQAWWWSMGIRPATCP